MTVSRMQDYLPKYYDDSRVVTEMMTAETAEFDKLNAEMYRTLDQFFAMTSTYSLDRWERILDLPPMPNSSVEFRRRRVLVKLAGNAPATVEYLTDLVNQYVASKDATIIEYNEEQRFEALIPLEGEVDTVSIRNAVNEVKPAHLELYIAGLVREVLAIVNGVKQYEAPYPITNRFETYQRDGKLLKEIVSFLENPYAFIVEYPICNTFSTVGRNVYLNERLSFETLSEESEVTYNRVGNTHVGEVSL